MASHCVYPPAAGSRGTVADHSSRLQMPPTCPQPRRWNPSWLPTLLQHTWLLPPFLPPRFWDTPGRCRCSHHSPCLRDAPPTSSPHRPLQEASGALLRCFRACIGSWGTSCCKGHGGHVPATQDKGGLQTSLCPSEASAQDAAVVSWLVPAAALGARPGEGPAPGEQLWVPLPSITPKVKSRES